MCPRQGDGKGQSKGHSKGHSSRNPEQQQKPSAINGQSLIRRGLWWRLNKGLIFQSNKLKVKAVPKCLSLPSVPNLTCHLQWGFPNWGRCKVWTLRFHPKTSDWATAACEFTLFQWLVKQMDETRKILILSEATQARKDKCGMHTFLSGHSL